MKRNYKGAWITLIGTLILACGEVTHVGPGGDITVRITKYLAGTDQHRWQHTETHHFALQNRNPDTGRYDTVLTSTNTPSETVEYTFKADKADGQNYRPGILKQGNDIPEPFEWDIDSHGPDQQRLYLFFDNPDTSAGAYPIVEMNYPIQTWEGSIFSLIEADGQDPLLFRELIWTKQ